MSEAHETRDPRRPASLAPAGPSPRPATIGNYLLRKKLGEGAVGEVWLATDRVLGREVALKFFRGDAVRSDEEIRTLIKEARAAAALNHPNIATIYQAGRGAGQVYIAMEFVPGGSLADELRDKGALPWRKATQAVRDAAVALAEAHAAGLIHRDIKPSNLMRSARGLVKVVDFGLARSESFDAGVTRTQPGMLLGSPGYMSPEQCRGQRADARSDLYSLICTYYQLLTRQLPFESGDLASILYQHCHEPFPDASKKIPGIPDGVLRILARGSAKEQTQRYQSADQIRADLDSVLSMPELSHTFNAPVMCAVDSGDGPSSRSSATLNPHDVRPAKGKLRQIAVSLLRGQGVMGKLSWVAMFAVLCVAVGLTVHGILAAGGRSTTQSNAKAPPPNDAVHKANSGEPTPMIAPSANHRLVDLLPLADPGKGLHGKWKRNGGGISVVAEPPAPYEQTLLELPYEPPPEYDLRVEFSREDGAGDIQQVLEHSGSQFNYGIDMWVEGYAMGFQDDRGFPDKKHCPAIVRRPRPLENNRKHVSIVSVRNDSLSATLDGEKLVSYSPKWEKLATWNRWAFAKAHLGVGTWKSTVTFYAIEVTEISGEGKITSGVRSPSTEAAVHAAGNLLPFIDSAVRLLAWQSGLTQETFGHAHWNTQGS